MDNARFDALVAKHEAEARSRPGLYRFKVFLLALLGNGYIGFVLLALLALVASLILAIAYLRWLAIKALIWIVPVIWMVLQTLRVSIDPPEGFELGEKNAPALFALIRDLRRKVNAPRFHHVLVTNDFNAAVVQSPRLGVFGWYRNYLLIGLPLLQALSVEQFSAVLAHEFGHLAKGHGRTSNWIYRQRLRWGRLFEAFSHDKSRWGFLFKPFLAWFSPYFNAFTFPLARSNEYTADALSAAATSPAIAAQTLTRVEVIGSYLSEKFWPQIHRRAHDEPSPQFSPYRIFGERVVAELDEESIRRWLEQALERETSSADTHPSLRDRLQALGEAPALVEPAAGSDAAGSLLGNSLEEITEYCGDRWQHAVFEHWRHRYNEVQTERASLNRLEEKLEKAGELDLAEAYERAVLTERVSDNGDSALAQFRILHERAPDDAMINFSLGARLLWRDDENGVALVERAMALDEDATCRALEVLRDYHWRNGREELAKSLHERLVARSQLESAAEAERRAILNADRFDPHAFNAEELAALLGQLQQVEGVKRAYLVRKRLRYLPHKPLYVLGFTIERGFGLRPRYTHDEVMYRLKNKVTFPYPAFLIGLRINRRLAYRICRIESARIL